MKELKQNKEISVFAPFQAEEQNKNSLDLFMQKDVLPVMDPCVSSSMQYGRESNVQFLKKVLSLYNLTYYRFSYEKCGMRLLLEEVLISLRAQINERHIVVRVYGEENIPVFSSPELIKLILHNVLENAVCFSKENIQRAYIEVDFSVEDKKMRIIVEDNGVGIAEQHLPHIFQPFYCGKNPSGGKGLGLYLVLKALEMLGGAVKVDSVAGCYSKFVLTLPLLV